MIPARSNHPAAPQPAPKLGELLVRRGCISQDQCDQVLDEQRRTGRPFGEIAEAMFNLDPAALESAWADQYQAITGLIDPRRESTDVRVLSMISRRQAWQFRILPLRMDGAEVMICTAKEHLPRALRFAYSRFGPGCYFVLAEPDHLGQALERHYPMPGARDELAAWHAGRHAAGA
ncbi:MAG: hypothetical protein KIT68_11155 [Phycisphaeraceae bacterium]|nr:hypothetical protein [Phycisphaeraceae bacterium]